ncbi:hypothetical protein BCR34DRAFT_599872 [Clohesyomyces aquaticus]|uniref:CFEM domain-containing protein n=1 Tax=Clohesyomyces aquaticus TaxID=1231657 RepID=A0A1Y1ZTD9_9PLEO|nr:hypothetical protein BCR34DRAFT_599872 [Clohesyomyces aquaticus]
MKTFAAAAFIALASVASAQLDNIPSCALSCFLATLTADGCSSITDFACHCKKSDSLFASVTPCVQKACSAADQATVITAVEGTCKAAGVPITVPQPSSAAPVSSAAPSTSASPASSAAAVSSAASYAASSAASAASSKASSLASVISSALATPTHSGNGTAPTASPSPSQFTGAAAPQATRAAGIIAAAGLAFLAL